MKSKLILCTAAVCMLLLSSCGPSAAQVATMTASAWTATPPPTPTATPIPYGLTVRVADESGVPIAGADISFPESGSDQPVQTDASGQYVWNNLPGSAATLKVSASGYFSAEQAAPLQRGPNEVKVALKGDPLGLRAADACAPDEKPLYIEDFQDGKAQGWQNITGAAEFGAKNGWMLGPIDEGNNAVYFTGLNENLDTLKDFTFENLVWRLRVMTNGSDGFSFLNLRFVPSPEGGTRYIVQWGANPLLDLSRLQMPGAGGFGVDRSNFRAKQGTWYYFELSAYQGQIQVWVDGKQEIEYQDPKPFGPGMIGLEAHITKDPKTLFAFDNLSVCELSAPFTTSLYKPPAK